MARINFSLQAQPLVTQSQMDLPVRFRVRFFGPVIRVKLPRRQHHAILELLLVLRQSARKHQPHVSRHIGVFTWEIEDQFPTTDIQVTIPFQLVKIEWSLS